MRSARYLLLALGLAAGQAAVASDFSANIGFMSDYIFRGIKQSDSGAFGGIDWTREGFYAGAWTADVGQGLEYDLYAGYGGSLGNVDWGLGYTGYFYTDEFDDTYQELNLSLGWGVATVEYAHGRYENFDAPSQGYGFWLGKLEHLGAYVAYGRFTRAFDGSYWELGYGTEVAGLNAAIALIDSSEELVHHPAGISGETYFVFSLSKTFESR